MESLRASPHPQARFLWAVTRDTLLQIRRTVGYVFQDPDDQLFMPTVAEDVAFGPLNLGLSRDETRARVAESLAAVVQPAVSDSAVIGDYDTIQRTLAKGFTHSLSEIACEITSSSMSPACCASSMCWRNCSA